MKLKTNLLICASLVSFYGYSNVAFAEQEPVTEPLGTKVFIKAFGITEAQASKLVGYITDEAKKMKADFPGKSLNEMQCKTETAYGKVTCASRNYEGNHDLVGAHRNGTRNLYGIGFTLNKLHEYDETKSAKSEVQINIEQTRWNNTTKVDQIYGDTVIKLD